MSNNSAIVVRTCLFIMWYGFCSNQGVLYQRRCTAHFQPQLAKASLIAGSKTGSLHAAFGTTCLATTDPRMNLCLVEISILDINMKFKDH